MAAQHGSPNGNIDESYYLSGVYCANPKKGWIVGAHNIHDYTVRVLPPHLVMSKQVWLHTTDGGQTWQFMTEKEIDTVPHEPSLHGKVFANLLEGCEDLSYRQRRSDLGVPGERDISLGIRYFRRRCNRSVGGQRV